MIENDMNCYLFKEQKDTGQRIYHRAYPDNSEEGDGRWNTFNKFEAGCLSKKQWQQRSTKWAVNRNWMLESTTGEVEAL